MELPLSTFCNLDYKSVHNYSKFTHNYSFHLYSVHSLSLRIYHYTSSIHHCLPAHHFEVNQSVKFHSHSIFTPNASILIFTSNESIIVYNVPSVPSTSVFVIHHSLLSTLIITQYLLLSSSSVHLVKSPAKEHNGQRAQLAFGSGTWTMSHP